MPQGCAKKIQVQLLLADFPFQLGDPPLCRRRILAARCHGRLRSHRDEQRAANLLQCVRPLGQILSAPRVFASSSRPLYPNSVASAVTSSAASISDIARSLNSRVQRVFF